MKPFIRPTLISALAASLAMACGVAPDSTPSELAAHADSLTISCPIFASCFFVDTTADSGAGSLRQAILDANAATGTRIIKFNIPGAGPHVIQTVQYLPMLLGDTKIDGYSQPGSSPATDTSPPVIEVVLNGRLSTGNWGLNLGVGNNTVQGLAVNDFPGSGIVINSSGNHVRGNVLGADRTGTFARPNAQAGVNINSGEGNLIGGADIADRNVISGNGAEGVVIFPPFNEVYGNVIGTNFDGTAPLGNGGSGVAIYGAGSNEIGGTQDGEANIIGFNLEDGIAVFAGGENTLSRNSIFSNGGLGIDLEDDGVTPNDGLLDPDSGANDLQNFPSLRAVTLDPTTLHEGRYKAEVTWQLKGEASTKFRVEFFASGACDPSGRGEAERFLGSRAIDTDASGFVQNMWRLPGLVAPGEVITATATKLVPVAGTHDDRETSELSKCLTAELCSRSGCSASAPVVDDE
jgi:trimeric autotransporter adhesin